MNGGIDYFTNLHTNLLMSFAKEIQAQNLITGTRDFLIKSSLVYGYKLKQVIAK